MKRLALLMIMMFGCILSFGQNISLTFSGTGAATFIDSVKATNLTTNQSVTFPGNETLVLTGITGIPAIAELVNPGLVFPNPFSGKTTFVTTVQMPQMVDLKIRNLVGQVIAQTQSFIQPGENAFSISINTAGIYLITLTADQGTVSCKVICTETSSAGNNIQYLGSSSNNNHNNHNNHNNSSSPVLKSSQTTYSLGYSDGDIILYRCRSSIYTTIVTDSPKSSKNYEVEFVDCIDPVDARSYSVVKIGYQTWMAENLAYLPYVSPASTESDTNKQYYVINSTFHNTVYNGTNIDEAKKSIQYNNTGVLYNWPAAQTACPPGWRLPFDEDWQTLEKYLGMSSSESDSTGWRTSGVVGGKLLSTVTNESGFSAINSGNREEYITCCIDGGTFISFWSASEFNASQAWIRDLSYGVGRYPAPRFHGYSVRCLKGAYLPEVTTANISEPTETSVLAGGSVLSDGGDPIIAKGVCWSTSPAPTLADSTTTDGSAKGAFTTRLSGLTQGTLYYARAYATNSIGTGYGEQKQLRTRRADGLAAVTTSAITSITDTSALSGGEIPKDGSSFVIERGVCWSTLPNPTISDSKTGDGSGWGSFGSCLTGLSPDTVYYVRAYATNAAGTAYGEQKRIETPEGTFNYDGRNYAYKTIGSQIWMIENLAYLPSVSTGTPREGQEFDPFYYVLNYYGTSVKEARTTANYSTYGVLYNWEAARTACPSGWKLPSDTDWTVLTNYLISNGYGVGGSGTGIGKAMAAQSGWHAGSIGNDPASNNRSGFSALPAGKNVNYYGFTDVGRFTNFWSASEEGVFFASKLELNSYTTDVSLYSDLKIYGLSVRCLKGNLPAASFTISPSFGIPSTNFQFDASGSTDAETPASDLEVRWDWNGDGTWDTGYEKVKTNSHQYTVPGTYRVILEVKNRYGLCNTTRKTVTVFDGILTDSRDGNEYFYKTIGSQTWMAGNLGYLPVVSPSSPGSDASPFYYVYGYEGNSVSDAKVIGNYSTYGVLYNWEAAKFACPSGWYLPGDEDWKILEKNQGMSTSDADSYADRISGTVGGKLKETGTDHWSYPNTEATNGSGFAALPGGSRSDRFSGLGENASFWSASDINYPAAIYRGLGLGSGVLRNSGNRSDGFSVRCLKTGPAPTASFTISPPFGIPSTNFRFDASGCTDPETPARDLEVRWDWNGDGTWDTGYDKTKIIYHQYTLPGSCMVILEVKDGDGLVGSQIKTVVVDSTFTDSRDEHEYRCTTIGTQTWMIENLAYLPAVSPSSSGSDSSSFYYVNGYEGSNIIEAKATANYNTFGVLYNWTAASAACPSGWHLPKDEEWTVLSNYLGTDAGKKMKFNDWWFELGNGNNASGFTALPGGSMVYTKGFDSPGQNAYFWSASAYNNSYAWYRNLNFNHTELFKNNLGKSDGFSVRCVKNTAPTASFTVSPAFGSTSTNFQFDASASFDIETNTLDLMVRWDWNGDGIWDTGYEKSKKRSHQYTASGRFNIIMEVKDGDGSVDTETRMVTVFDGILTDSRDGNEYYYQTIGTQTWMIENLAYLPVVSPSTTDSGTEKLYHVYKYQGTSITEARESDNYKTYGVLYNWPAAMNGESGSTSNPSGVQGVCPSGWHLPSDAEWTKLTDYLGPAAGIKMKAASGWSTGNGDNSSSFTALPGGYRNLNGGFAYLGKNAWFWSTSADGPENALVRYLDGYFDGVIRDTKDRGYGYSVRCLRD